MRSLLPRRTSLQFHEATRPSRQGPERARSNTRPHPRPSVSCPETHESLNFLSRFFAHLLAHNSLRSSAELQCEDKLFEGGHKLRVWLELVLAFNSTELRGEMCAERCANNLERKFSACVVHCDGKLRISMVVSSDDFKTKIT